MSAETEIAVVHETLTIKRFGNDHQAGWAVAGIHGGIHCWHALDFRHGGIEVHGRNPFEYSKPEPDNEKCWVLDGPCWHDGSSLWWIERGKSIVSDAAYQQRDDDIFRTLLEWYESKFSCFARLPEKI